MKETFGQRFTKFRKESNLTQQEIAEKLNISSQAVSKWENDLSSPDISLLGDIADIFHISIDQLLGKEDDKVIMVDQNEVSDKKINIDDLVFKIKVLSNDGDIVKVNLPLAIIKILAKTQGEGEDSFNISGIKGIDKIDFKQLLSLVEKGILGNLISVVSSDGDIVRVYVGRLNEEDDKD